MNHEQRLANLRKYFKASNKGYSIEREDMLGVIAEMDGPFSAVDLHKKARSRGLDISPSGVYRNIAVFVDAGIIDEIRLSKEKIVFERNINGENNFLFCIVCSKVIKVKSGVMGDIQKKICKESNFEFLNHTYQIKGYCSECRSKLKEAVLA